MTSRNVSKQYIQDKQEVTLKDRFRVHIGPSGDFSDIQAGMSEIRTKSDHPQVALDVLNAATSDVPVLQSVLTLSARRRHSPSRLWVNTFVTLTPVNYQLIH